MTHSHKHKMLKQLITECFKVFPETIKKEVTFHDANVLDHWGEEPPEEETYDEPWESWTELTDFDIVRGNWSGIFTHMYFDEVLFYIPAFMKYTLEDELHPKRKHDCDTVWESTLAFLGKHYDQLDSYKIDEMQKEFIKKLE